MRKGKRAAFVRIHGYLFISFLMFRWVRQLRSLNFERTRKYSNANSFALINSRLIQINSDVRMASVIKIVRYHYLLYQDLFWQRWQNAGSDHVISESAELYWKETFFIFFFNDFNPALITYLRSLSEEEFIIRLAITKQKNDSLKTYMGHSPRCTIFWKLRLSLISRLSSLSSKKKVPYRSTEVLDAVFQEFSRVKSARCDCLKDPLHRDETWRGELKRKRSPPYKTS